MKILLQTFIPNHTLTSSRISATAKIAFFFKLWKTLMSSNLCPVECTAQWVCMNVTSTPNEIQSIRITPENSLCSSPAALCPPHVRQPLCGFHPTKIGFVFWVSYNDTIYPPASVLFCSTCYREASSCTCWKSLFLFLAE